MTLQMKQIAKITEETPQQMKPTKRSTMLQVFVCISGITFSTIYSINRDNIALLYPTSFLWIVIALIAAYYEIDFNAFRLSMSTFRGLLMTVAMIVVVISNVSTPFLEDDDPEPLFTILLDDVTWIIAVLLMLSADSAPRITNIIRFFGPLCVLFFTSWQVISHLILIKKYNYTIFTLSYGSVTIDELEVAAKIQILFYGSTFLYGVPRDPKHCHFVLLDSKIKTKTLLVCRNIATDSTRLFNGRLVFKTKYMFHIIAVGGFIYAFMYVIAVLFDIVSIILVILAFIITVCVVVVMFILIYKYFQLFMLKELILQFRVNMLIVTIVILIYAAIQKIIWKRNADVTYAMATILNRFVFVLTCLFGLLSDGMNISYPKYFVIYFCVMLGIVSIWNVFVLSFGSESIQYPLWFLVIEKQAYYQVIVLCCVFVWCIWRDKESKYFVLIRRRKKTKELWGDLDANSAVNANDRIMDYDGNEQL